jgi:hypothetical protein
MLQEELDAEEAHKIANQAEEVPISRGFQQQQEQFHDYGYEVEPEVRPPTDIYQD